MNVVEFIADFPDYFLTYSVPNYVFGFFALLVFPVIALPIIIKLDLTERGFVRACACYFGWLVIILYGDLPFRAAQAQWLCKTRTGVHVYETVHTDGFISLGGSSFAGKGFSFVEYDGPTGLFRTLLVEDSPKTMKVDALISKYKLDDEPISHFCCLESRYTARELKGRRLLGEAVSIKIKPGWAATFFFSFIPVDRSGIARTCGAPDEPPSQKPKKIPSQMDLVGTVLLPKKSK